MVVDIISSILMPRTVSAESSDDQDNIRWMDEHPSAFKTVCGCLIDFESGSLRAMPTCAGHMRDVERWSKLGMGWK